MYAVVARANPKLARNMAARTIQNAVREHIFWPATQEAAATAIQNVYRMFRQMLIQEKWKLLIEMEREDRKVKNLLVEGKGAGVTKALKPV